MSVLAIIKVDGHEIPYSSDEVLAYSVDLGEKIGEDVKVLVLGNVARESLEVLGKGSVGTVYHCPFANLNLEILKSILEKIGDDVSFYILSQNLDNNILGGQISALKDSAFVSNVVTLAEREGNSIQVSKAVYTGKAFADIKVEINGASVLLVKKNVVKPNLSQGQEVQIVELNIEEVEDLNTELLGIEQAKTQMSLSDADAIVSGGRGMGGPENWNVLEDFAAEIGAATGCSKPVSDMNWRPHHEHVGQTGVKVSPNLYIAVGISGAIQHIAGVNGSHKIFVINTDSEAPFFKVADYGIVGDAMVFVPKLTEAIRKIKEK
ncbi:electron transfer flavoprotein subunit alpha/FixB family protein [Aureibacter tunicatorum]|uniref:Electron transfer flavoprotein alpha subunit n=1 Tax=Aureibacter tunicatorum TaxID=866807 RepID=A0AAE3XNF7_9BACT|nr:electron transfer flavoprotein subunit alpha/FixB family protein [Aureibacter tunicatorum]MDR6239100.1 electron transfer flavoprotein alpha subunit [Aureibacter tunicatorum]BDD04974.1 electron transfer flavoprotein subunit alpha [Aureibacter tunicatorum]